MYFPIPILAEYLFNIWPTASCLNLAKPTGKVYMFNCIMLFINELEAEEINEPFIQFK